MSSVGHPPCLQRILLIKPILWRMYGSLLFQLNDTWMINEVVLWEVFLGHLENKPAYTSYTSCANPKKLWLYNIDCHLQKKFQIQQKIRPSHATFQPAESLMTTNWPGTQICPSYPQHDHPSITSLGPCPGPAMESHRNVENETSRTSTSVRQEQNLLLLYISYSVFVWFWHHSNSLRLYSFQIFKIFQKNCDTRIPFQKTFPRNCPQHLQPPITCNRPSTADFTSLSLKPGSQSSKTSYINP